MLNYAFWTMIRRHCGYGATVPVLAPAIRNHTRNRVKQCAPPQPHSRVRLSRVTGPRLALRVIADSVGQIAGFPRHPHDTRDIQVAWLQLGDLVGGFVQALIALGEMVPQFLVTRNEEVQFELLEIRAKRSPATFIQAIWREASIRAPLAVTSLLANRVKRQFQGHIPKAVRTNGAAGKRELHVMDSMDRPLICRVLTHPEGRLEILDAGGGFLHRNTLILSCWRLSEGWITVGGFRPSSRSVRDEDGPSNPELRPHPINP